MAKLMLISEIIAKSKSNYLSDISLTEAELNELTESIRHDGIKVPLIIQKKTNVLIDGYNRLQIAKKLKFTEVPVEVQDIKDADIELTQYLLQVGRRNLKDADRKMIIGRLINLKKIKAEDAEKIGMKKGAAKFAAKVVEIVDESGGKLGVKEVQKLVKVKGLKGAKESAKEVKKTGEDAKVVISKAIIEKKTKLSPQQVMEPIMLKFEQAFDEYPNYQDEFKAILKSFLANV